MHMHACHGALACDPLFCARVFRFDTFTFPNVVPLASTIEHWDNDTALGPSQKQYGKCRRQRPDTCSQICPDPLWPTLLLTKRTPESGASDLNFRLRRPRIESERQDSGPRSAKPDLVRQSLGPRIQRQRLQVRQLERSMKFVSLRLRTSSSNRRSQGA